MPRRNSIGKRIILRNRNRSPLVSFDDDDDDDDVQIKRGRKSDETWPDTYTIYSLANAYSIIRTIYSVAQTREM